MTTNDSKPIIANIHRMQGQLSGIERMIHEQRDCADIVTQLLAIKSALDSVARTIMSSSAGACMRSGSKKDLKKLQETLDSVFRYI